MICFLSAGRKLFTRQYRVYGWSFPSITPCCNEEYTSGNAIGTGSAPNDLYVSIKILFSTVLIFRPFISSGVYTDLSLLLICLILLKTYRIRFFRPSYMCNLNCNNILIWWIWTWFIICITITVAPTTLITTST